MMISKRERDLIYRKFKRNVNMTCSQLRKWAANPCSRKASLSRNPIKRNLHLLCTPKSEWTEVDFKKAKRTIAFNKRMKGMPKGKPASKQCPSKRDISLKNWAWDPSKSR